MAEVANGAPVTCRQALQRPGQPGESPPPVRLLSFPRRSALGQGAKVASVTLAGSELNELCCRNVRALRSHLSADTTAAGGRAQALLQRQSQKNCKRWHKRRPRLLRPQKQQSCLPSSTRGSLTSSTSLVVSFPSLFACGGPVLIFSPDCVNAYGCPSVVPHHSDHDLEEPRPITLALRLLPCDGGRHAVGDRGLYCDPETRCCVSNEHCPPFGILIQSHFGLYRRDVGAASPLPRPPGPRLPLAHHFWWLGLWLHSRSLAHSELCRCGQRRRKVSSGQSCLALLARGLCSAPPWGKCFGGVGRASLAGAISQLSRNSECSPLRRSTLAGLPGEAAVQYCAGGVWSRWLVGELSVGYWHDLRRCDSLIIVHCNSYDKVSWSCALSDLCHRATAVWQGCGSGTWRSTRCPGSRWRKSTLCPLRSSLVWWVWWGPQWVW